MAIYKGSDFIGVNSVKEKKVYVEVPEGSTIDDMSESNTIAISSEQYEELQDAVKWRTGSNDNLNLQQMIDKMKTSFLTTIKLDLSIGQNSFEEPWTRPQEWPNLDSLNLASNNDTPDYIYMTYDATSDLAAVALHIEGVSGGTPISCTIGHITNSEYIVDETINGSSNNYVYWFNNYQYDYPVVRVLGSIKYCYLYSVTNSNNQVLYYRKQPIVERIAHVPNLIKFCTSYSANAWSSYTLERDKVSNGNGMALTSLYYAWSYARKLRSLDISKILTPNVTTMECCFNQCFSLTGTLDLRHWNVSKVTTLQYAFGTCRHLVCIDLRGWETNALTNISYCFQYNSALEEIKGIENLNVNNCKSLAAVFVECFSLKTLDLEQWNVSQVTSLASLFASCYSLQELEISTWDIRKVTNLNSTFSNCFCLEELKIENWQPIKVNNLSSTFSYCRSLKGLDLSNWTTDTLTTIYYIFGNCNSLQELKIPNLIITNSCTNIYAAFNGCWSLKELHLNPTWDVSGVTSANNTANSMFNGCYSLQALTGISNWHFTLSNGLNSMFASCYSLKTLDISGWYVNTITSFASMFSNCFSLSSLNLSSWNVQSATNFSNMFYCCYNLTELNLASWNTSNCTTFANMFYNCYSLATVGNLSNWNTSKVTTIADMFVGCRSLKELKGLSNWDVSKVTTAAEFLYGARALKEVIIENWNLASCTSISSIFREMNNLETLSLKNWSIPKITAGPTYFCTPNYNLKNVYYTVPIPYNHSYGSSEALTHESLLVILNTLPTVSTTRTLNIATNNINMLTTAEKAIATNKGWTLAN